MKKAVLFALLLSFPLLAFADQTAGGSDRLSFADAQARKGQVESVNYTVRLNFQKDAANFSGTVNIRATLLRTDLPLRVDTLASEIQAVKVNGKRLNDFHRGSGFLLLPAQYLATQTSIKIEYSAGFSPGTDGIFRVKDPSDGNEYIYTNLEPYGAHRVFPCFDQPDLRATFSLEVTAPQDWTVISNTAALSKDALDNGALKTTFQTSLRFSTYLFFVGAGPYQAWSDQHNGLPLTIYARKSIAARVDAEDIFSVTKKGLDFFGDYFGVSYPFPKYDHIFTPELGNGAMENPGAVAMNEKMIFHGQPSPIEKFERAETILHEMAHMWFGDLVTMKWWNDLWLNESFASYMALLAADRALGAGEGAWQGFFNFKGWGYWQDQLVTTHPIVVPVLDTDMADSIFDGITYAKGGSVLKQLHFYVGEQGFRDGVRSYFRKYAWKNTEMNDFLQEIALSSGKSLDRWGQEWLETAGLNRIEPRWECSEGRISSFQMLQEKTVAGRYLPHRTRVGLFQKGDKMAMKESVDVTFDGPVTEVPEAIGLSCPDFVYANVDDQDYGIYSLDAKSLAALGDNVFQFSSAFTRQMLWSSLGQMVKDLKLPNSKFLGMTLAGLAGETDFLVLGGLISRHGSVTGNLNYLSSAARTKLGPPLEARAWAKIQENKENLGLRQMWLEHYLNFAYSNEGAKNLKAMLAGSELTQYQRWMVIKQLSKLGDAESMALVDAELKRDLSNSAQASAFAARTAFPNLAQKTAHWDAITNFGNDLSYSMRGEGAENFHSAYYPALSAAFVDKYFEHVKSVDWDQYGFFAEISFSNLFPYYICSNELLQRSEAELGAMSQLPLPVKNAWLMANDMLKQCVTTRAFDSQE